jgi:molybdenum cofactor cytidylyltransferase
VDIDCLLLAAGSSSRVGEPKLLLTIGGRTLLEVALENHLLSGVKRICAVVPGWIEGFEAMARKHRSERVDFLSLPEEGEMSASLRAGWKHIAGLWGPEAVMVSLADMPLVTAEIIDTLMGRFAGAGCAIGVPVYAGTKGHPVILSAELGDEVENLTGDRGARSIVEAREDRVLEVPVHSDAVLIDVDTAADLDEVKRRLGDIG